MRMVKSSKISPSETNQMGEGQKTRRQLIIQSQDKGLVKSNQKEIKGRHHLSQFKTSNTPAQENYLFFLSSMN